ncbi:hypothetical protein CLOM_g8407 [Closterium sp. NIES-68]|nr:hypothetical protein CLOM_g8407 [Closterium sp. NIES-68]GJP76703.1 hypothetical protein CLOP_g7170 [Closterium sp. NIES-67]
MGNGSSSHGKHHDHRRPDSRYASYSGPASPAYSGPASPGAACQRHSEPPATARSEGGIGGGGGSVSRSSSFGYSRALQHKYGIIPDTFRSIAQEKLREVGLESSNLIVAVDFTKSNEWTGKQSFGGRSLHAIAPGVANPYEQAIDIIGQTLSAFDEDNLIPCYGFGDVTTHDSGVFAFNEGQRPCNGFEEALQRYRAIAPHVQLSGPTSFAPAIEAAVRAVEESGGQYHVLLIIADGQVTRSVDTPPGVFSKQEQDTVDAIVAASNYALSIVMVGVGDGPWDMMEEFDDALPQRNFDNFQFVNFTRVMASSRAPEQRAALFALSALMEVPLQYRACTEMGLLGRTMGRMPPSVPKEPPPRVRAADAAAARAASLAAATMPPHLNPDSAPNPFGDPLGTPSAYTYGAGSTAAAADAAPASGGAGAGGSECPVCLLYPKNTAFQCGHQTCEECSRQMSNCPICRAPVTMRIKLYS